MIALDRNAFGGSGALLRGEPFNIPTGDQRGLLLLSLEDDAAFRFVRRLFYRAVEERWIAYSIELKDGTIATGLIDSEDAQSVTLKVPGGVTQTYARSDIETMASTETSLMPAGLEAALTPEDMADLIAVLKTHRASN